VQHKVIDISFFADLTAGGSALTDRSIEVPDLAALSPDRLQQPSTYVPHRNLLFLALGAGHAESVGASEVFYGAQAQDRYGYWDCTAEFVSRLNAVLGLNRGSPVTVCAPFVGWSKADVLKIGLELGVDYAHTWTCYRGGTSACGTCPSCVERSAAFRAFGVADPLS
jgi:7-cyano-7-deazaguanine synthase